MKISVIIPAYNAEKYLARAVESLLNTGYPALEIVVVDDGSGDLTLDVAKKMMDMYPQVVKVYRHPDMKNHGVSASRNLGINKSTGELICFLDADDYVFPHRFETAVPLLQNNPDVDGVYELTEMVFETEKDKNKWEERSKIFGISGPVKHDQLLKVLLTGVPWHPNSFICRRSLIDISGGFNEKLNIAEDCNLWLRMVCAGNIVHGNMDKPISAYYRHTNNTYEYSIERKVDMIKAILDTYCWLCNQSFKNLIKSKLMIYDGLKDYVLNSIIVCREGKRQEIAWQVISVLLKNRCFNLLIEPLILKQFAWLVIETAKGKIS